MGAIVALPMAAMVTALIKQCAHNYPVVYQSAYDDPVPSSTDRSAHPDRRHRRSEPRLR
jgi:hypothetical protein